MSLASLIDALERLAALDATLKELQDERERERGGLSSKQGKLAELAARAEQAAASVADMERLRGELHQEIRQTAQQVERSREKAARCRNEREAQAVQREQEELRRLHRDREQELEKLVGLLAAARAEVEALNAERAALSGELGSTSGAVESRLGEVEQALAAREAERKALVQEVPPAVYRRYEQVRVRKGSALAWTGDGKCSACHILLSPMAFQQLKRGVELGQCPSCMRLLYYRPGEIAPAEQASGSA